MAPPSATARRAPATSPDVRTRPAPGRAPLRVVPRARRGARAPRRLSRFAPLAIVVAALLAVVVGQAMLANGQIAMSSVEQRLAAAQATHRQLELAVSQLETPARIISTSTVDLHMVHPAHIVQLPYVPLTTPIPTPHVTAAPAVPPATSTGSTASTGSSSSGQ
ncbi:MAG TPA: hypothetical protein VL961_06395 [Acidimicrobiales bacterium]|nr:hypothetical protein [Acidimicrobiales bacterium]